MTDTVALALTLRWAAKDIIGQAEFNESYGVDESETRSVVLHMNVLADYLEGSSLWTAKEVAESKAEVLSSWQVPQDIRDTVEALNA